MKQVKIKMRPRWSLATTAGSALANGKPDFAGHGGKNILTSKGGYSSVRGDKK
ncbi:MAG: hypothetical protein KQH53_07725 [Desulfarculaceae bacterium]|nr:hypothetical protein [Desulfarculaceae bacterium]